MCHAGFLIRVSRKAGGRESVLSHSSLHLLRGKLSPVPRQRDAIWSCWAALTSAATRGQALLSHRGSPRDSLADLALELAALAESCINRPATQSRGAEESGGAG
ncbi:unnamed protein product [Lota lota]